MKKLIILLTLACNLQAASFLSVSKKILTNRWVVLGMVETAFFFDAKTTIDCVNAGTCKEANPLLPNPTVGRNRQIFTGFKIGEGLAFAGADAFVYHRAKKRNEPVKAWTSAEYGIIGLQGFVDYKNWQLTVIKEKK